MDSKQKTEDPPTAVFCLNSQSSTFTSRSQDIFANLGVIEDKHSAFIKAQTNSLNDDGKLLKPDPDEESDDFSSCQKPTEHERNKRTWSNSSDYASRSRDMKDQDHRKWSNNMSKDFPNKRDIVSKQERGVFRKPRGSAPHYRNRGLPDFKKNPEKYTCYSLGDVSENDMSERSNAKAAFAFLEEKRKERERLERIAAGLPEEEVRFDVDNGACSQGRISFNRKNQKEKRNGEQNNEKKVGDVNLVNPGSKILDLNDTDDLCKEDSNACLDENETSQFDIFTNRSDSKATMFKAKGKKQRNIRKKEDNSDDSDG